MITCIKRLYSRLALIFLCIEDILCILSFQESWFCIYNKDKPLFFLVCLKVYFLTCLLMWILWCIQSLCLLLLLACFGYHSIYFPYSLSFLTVILSLWCWKILLNSFSFINALLGLIGKNIMIRDLNCCLNDFVDQKLYSNKLLFKNYIIFT